jgi:hypothetical protein
MTLPGTLVTLPSTLRGQPCPSEHSDGATGGVRTKARDHDFESQ